MFSEVAVFPWGIYHGEGGHGIPCMDSFLQRSHWAQVSGKAAVPVSFCVSEENHNCQREGGTTDILLAAPRNPNHDVRFAPLR